MLFWLRIVPRKLRIHVEHPHQKHCQRCLRVKRTRRSGKPLHGVHEQQHRNRTEERQEPKRYHGGSVPLYHRKRIHQGNSCFQPRKARRPHRGPRWHVPERRSTARIRTIRWPRGNSSALSWPYGSYRRSTYRPRKRASKPNLYLYRLGCPGIF